MASPMRLRTGAGSPLFPLLAQATIWPPAYRRYFPREDPPALPRVEVCQNADACCKVLGLVSRMKALRD